jgi:hypothetical protein
MAQTPYRNALFAGEMESGASAGRQSGSTVMKPPTMGISRSEGELDA